MIEHIHALQQELIETNVREADNENTIRDLKQRVHELEAANKRLKETPPDHCVAGLQDELISVKMREAEASLSLKEMRQRLAELESQWTVNAVYSDLGFISDFFLLLEICSTTMCRKCYRTKARIWRNTITADDDKLVGANTTRQTHRNTYRFVVDRFDKRQ